MLLPETGGRVVCTLCYIIEVVILLSLSLVQFFGELVEYWAQHILIFFIVPPYLIYIWGNNLHKCIKT